MDIWQQSVETRIGGFERDFRWTWGGMAVGFVSLASLFIAGYLRLDDKLDLLDQKVSAQIQRMDDRANARMDRLEERLDRIQTLLAERLPSRQSATTRPRTDAGTETPDRDSASESTLGGASVGGGSVSSRDSTAGAGIHAE